MLISIEEERVHETADFWKSKFVSFVHIIYDPSILLAASPSFRTFAS